MKILALTVAAMGMVAGGCADSPLDVGGTNAAITPQSSNAPVSPGNYTAGNVDIVSPFVRPDGSPIRDTYKYEAWRTGPFAAVQGRFHHHTDLTNGNANLQGDVLCFTIIGNRARIGGVVTRSNNPSIPVGSELTWSVADNTESRKGDPRDTASPLLGADAEAYCAFGLPYPESALDKNNYVIVAR
jgi:hypothetical protein